MYVNSWDKWLGWYPKTYVIHLYIEITHGEIWTTTPWLFRMLSQWMIRRDNLSGICCSMINLLNARVINLNHKSGRLLVNMLVHCIDESWFKPINITVIRYSMINLLNGRVMNLNHKGGRLLVNMLVHGVHWWTMS